MTWFDLPYDARNVAKAAGDDNGRWSFDQLLLERFDETRIRVSATEGHRAVWRLLEGEHEGDAITVPAAVWKAAKPKKTRSVRVVLDGDKWNVINGDATVAIPAPNEARFPKLEKFLVAVQEEAESMPHISVDVAHLKALLDAVEGGQVFLAIGEKQLVVCTSDVGGVRDRPSSSFGVLAHVFPSEMEKAAGEKFMRGELVERLKAVIG